MDIRSIPMNATYFVLVSRVTGRCMLEDTGLIKAFNSEREAKDFLKTVDSVEYLKPLADKNYRVMKQTKE